MSNPSKELTDALFVIGVGDAKLGGEFKEYGP